MAKKKKNCQKGYSCGYTCISVTKACLVEFPDGISVSLDNRSVMRSYPIEPRDKGSAPDPKPKIEKVSSKGAFEYELYKQLLDRKDYYTAKLEEYKDKKEEDLSPQQATIKRNSSKLLKKLGELEKQKDSLLNNNDVPDYLVMGEESRTKFVDEQIASGAYDKDFGPLNKANKTSWSKKETKEIRDILKKEPVNAALRKVYEIQGFDSKPTIVDSVEDIRFNNNIMKDDNGRPLVFFRAVDDPLYHEELKNGDKHFTGTGIYGNGTYFAAQAPADKGADLGTAVGELYYYGNKGIAAGLHKDAKVWTGTYDELKQLSKDLSKKYGGEMNLGVLMAMEGYDAYLGRNTAKGSGFPSYITNEGEPNYWVVLNRGALVIADGAVLDDYR
jgi:hypothetical protein